MKIHTAIGCAACIGALLAPWAPTFAAAEETPAAGISPDQANAFYMQQLDESSGMLAQVALARKSLDLGMNDDAVLHINKALDVAAKLEKQSPALAVATTLRFGKQVYTFNNQYKDYLIPAVDDMFTVDDYDTRVTHTGKNQQKKVTDEAVANAGISRYRLQLDIRNVDAALHSAKDFAQKGEIEHARLALNDIYTGAVETSAVYEDPVWAVHDNLMVANAMLRDKDYEGARFALKRADSGLKAIEKSGLAGDDAGALAGMQKEVTALRNTLRADNPDVLQKAGESISHWLESLRGIGAKHAAHKSGKAG